MLLQREGSHERGFSNGSAPETQEELTGAGRR